MTRKPPTSVAELKDNALARCRFQLSFLYSVPIGVLGGLIGLGGAEFRLPVLAGTLGYPVRQAVPLNLAVSLITIVASLAIRGKTLSFDAVILLLPVLLSLIAGAILTSSPPYKCGDSSPSGTIKEPTLNGVDASQSTACNQVLHALHVRFQSRNALPRPTELISYEFYFCLQGWTYVLPTIAFSAFSTPALTVAVSTCLEPRGGLCIRQPNYTKSRPRSAGLESHYFGHR